MSVRIFCVCGGLPGGNVMLTVDSDSPHGFCAKVADFGMARNMDAQARLQVNSYGTITHMAPEVLKFGTLSKVRARRRAARRRAQAPSHSSEDLIESLRPL